jgi:hypothetical protein
LAKLPVERANEIAYQLIDQMVQELEDLIEMAFPADQLPFMEKPTARERFARYVTATDPADRAILFNDNYLEQLKTGEAVLPVSDFWRNALTVPSVFEELRKDFVRLYDQMMKAEFV